MILTVVDLPDPFGPRYPVTSPGMAVKETLFTAVVPGYCFVSARTSSIVADLTPVFVRKLQVPWNHNGGPRATNCGIGRFVGLDISANQERLPPLLFRSLYREQRRSGAFR